MDSSACYREGQLDAAVDAAAAELRRRPQDVDKRVFLIELLCLQGAFERADRQLDTLTVLAPKLALAIGRWRQLLRAAVAREQVLLQGRVPELVGEPTPHIQRLLELHLRVREDDPGQAGALAELEAARLPWRGEVDGRAVDDLRDLDDTLSGIIELLTTGGRYLWADAQQVESLEFSPPRRPLDLLWRPARVTLTGGAAGEAFVPVLYVARSLDPQARLGRCTEWRPDQGVVRGVGQRVWLAGDEALPLLQIHRIRRGG